MRREPLVDGSYLWLIPDVRTFGDRVARLPAPLRSLVERSGWLRGLLLFAGSLRRDTVVIRTGPGWRTLLLLRALLGRRRKLVVLHFLVHPPPDRPVARLARHAWDRIDRFAIRRAMREGQVLTSWEREEYAQRYGIPVDRFRVVPWPWRRTPADELPPAPGAPLVLSSGRALCDWPTLFAAAAGADWPLVVVCSREDLAEVERLNAGGRAEVRCEISPAEHAELLARATVFVVTMREAGVSQGHVRLMDAADAGVPAVVSDTRSLRGYVVPGLTAVVVPPEDPAAMREAIDRLLSDAAERERIRRAAWERSAGWTAQDYVAALADLIHGRPAVLGPKA
jgi:glycosyltransferase involved in cell wall biosynthesis